MFDVGLSEIVLLAIVALVVLGPEKLPHAARMAGAWIGRIRRMVSSVQAEIEKEVAAQEMRDSIKKEMERMQSSELAQSLKQDAAELNASLSSLGQDLQADTAPAVEKPGEDAFRAHVQSSYSQNTDSTAPNHAAPGSAASDTPPSGSGTPSP